MKAFFLVTSLLFCSLYSSNIHAHSTHWDYEAQYQSQMPLMEQLKIQKNQIQAWHVLLSELAFHESLSWGNTKISYAGDYQDQILIQNSQGTLLLSEYCLLRYLHELSTHSGPLLNASPQNVWI